MTSQLTFMEVSRTVVVVPSLWGQPSFISQRLLCETVKHLPARLFFCVQLGFLISLLHFWDEAKL